MEKFEITQGQMIAASLISFGSLNTIDLQILAKIIKTHQDVDYHPTNYSNISQYIFSDGFNFFISDPELVKSNQITKIKSSLSLDNALYFIKNINIYSFLLQKITTIEGLTTNNLSKYFSQRHIEKLKKLKETGYIKSNATNIGLTIKGHMYLQNNSFTKFEKLFDAINHYRDEEAQTFIEQFLEENYQLNHDNLKNIKVSYNYINEILFLKYTDTNKNKDIFIPIKMDENGAFYNVFDDNQNSHTIIKSKHLAKAFHLYTKDS